MQLFTLICLFFHCFALGLLKTGEESPLVSWNEAVPLKSTVNADPQQPAPMHKTGDLISLEYQLKGIGMKTDPSTHAAAHDLLDNSFYFTPMKRTPEEFSPVYYGRKDKAEETEVTAARQQLELISGLAEKLIELKTLVKCVRQEIEKAMVTQPTAPPPLLLESSRPIRPRSLS